MDKACLEVRDLLALGGDINPNERIAIESHVSVCAECARELAETQSLIGHLALLREGDMPAGAADRIWRGVESAVPGRRRLAILEWTARAAAALVIGLAIGYTAVSIGRGTVAPGTTASEDSPNDSSSTYVPYPVEHAFGTRPSVPEPPTNPDVSLFQILPQFSTTSYYLPPVEEILEPDEVRF